MTEKERLRRKINDYLKYMGLVFLIKNNELPGDDGIRERRESE